MRRVKRKRKVKEEMYGAVSGDGRTLAVFLAHETNQQHERTNGTSTPFSVLHTRSAKVRSREKSK